MEQLRISDAATSKGHEAGTSASSGASITTRRLGVVKKVDAAARTCVVRWLSGLSGTETEPAEPGAERKEKEEDEEEVSFYQIMVHPDFKYRLGNVALRLPSLEQTRDTEGQQEGEQHQHQPTDKQWVGELIDIKDGKVLVHWADGTAEWLEPHQIYAIDT